MRRISQSLTLKQISHREIALFFNWIIRQTEIVRRGSFLASIWAFLILTLVYPNLAESALELNLKTDPNAPWRIRADKIQFDKTTLTYTAEGNVTLQQDQRKISADTIIYNTNTQKAFATGHVVLRAGNDVLRGQRLEMDLNDKTGIIHDARAFFKARHFFIVGDEIKKTGDDTYAARWASITTCDGDSPDWRITGKDINLSLEGYATAWHTTLWFKRVPVLYSPYFIVPIKQERQSGLLKPEISLSSNRKGFGYTQPLFWAINPSTDATIYWDYLEKRGHKWGAEFRYILDPRSKGSVMFDYLNDNEVDDGTGSNSENWGFTDDNFLRTNRDRYWFRMKHDQGDLPLGLTARIDLDVVSDQDYLREFKDGFTGFNASDSYFLNTFGRDLDDFDEHIRRNIVNFTRNWSKYRLNTGATWYDNVIQRRHNDIDPTDQRLPWLTFSGSKQQIFQSPLFYTLNAEYIHLYRQDGTEALNITSMHHTELNPRFFLPLRAGNYFTIEPSAGLRYNYWHINTLETDDPDQETGVDRNIYDIGTKFASEIYRIYQIGGRRFDKIKHSLRPQVTYRFIPEVDQDDIPNFSNITPIAKENVVTYTLTSTFTSKLKSSAGDSQIGPKPNRYDYREFLRFFLEQSYDFDEAKNSDIEDPEPLSPLFGEIRFAPTPNIWGRADMRWDFEENRSIENNLEAIFRDNRGDRLHARYRIKEDERESINLHLRLAITSRLSTYAQYERDLFEKRDVKRGLGWQYRSDCWTFSFDYIDENDDQRYAVAIFLHGLGGFRQSLSDTLDR